jgi:hypothetical protein
MEAEDGLNEASSAFRDDEDDEDNYDENGLDKMGDL